METRFRRVKVEIQMRDNDGIVCVCVCGRGVMGGGEEKKGCSQRLLREQIARTCLILLKEKGRS